MSSDRTKYGTEGYVAYNKVSKLYCGYSYCPGGDQRPSLANVKIRANISTAARDAMGANYIRRGDKSDFRWRAVEVYTHKNGCLCIREIQDKEARAKADARIQEYTQRVKDRYSGKTDQDKKKKAARSRRKAERRADKLFEDLMSH